MKIVVSGATGFVGRACTLALLGAGHQVTALARDPRRARGVLGAEAAIADLRDTEATRAALLAADGVVNLAGEDILARRWTAARRRVLWDSRVQTTATLVAHLRARRAPLSVFVSASAVGWYGDRGDELLDERAAGGADFTAELCRAWEDAALAAGSSASRVVLARLGIVLGGEGGALARLRPLFRLGLGGPVGGGAQWVPWIHLEDAARALRFLLEADGTRGAAAVHGPVNLVAPQPARNRELAAAVGAALGRPARLPAPALALRVALGARAALLLGGQRVEPAVLRAAGFAFRHPELGAAVAEALAPPAEVSIERAVERSAERAAELATPERRAAPPASPYLRARPARYELTCRTVIPRPLAEVFPFFAAPENLGALTPPDLRFTLDGPRPTLAADATIDYRLRALGAPLRWRTLLEAWEAPDDARPARARFVDAQLRGPYASWWHEHRFAEDAEDAGHTVMEDRVRYRPPLGWLGRLAHWLVLRAELRRIFAHRRRAILLRFGDDAPAAQASAQFAATPMSTSSGTES
ncbi:MAG: TIGR01777 family oxidoreductase [Kofleriaceae bacterium]